MSSRLLFRVWYTLALRATPASRGEIDIYIYVAGAVSTAARELAGSTTLKQYIRVTVILLYLSSTRELQQQQLITSSVCAAQAEKRFRT